jgi:LysM repeat protein
MSIDLISRLTNRRDGEQIIREASFNLVSPKKYGKKLNVLPILDKPGSQTVYNKILKANFEATSLFIEPSPISGSNQITPQGTVTEVVRTEYIPIFFNNNNISVSQTNSLVNATDKVEEVIFGPGKLRFVLSPFDNLLKFKVYTKNSAGSAGTLIPLDLNVNASRYKIVFETNSGKVSVENTRDAQLENLSTGVLAFNVSKKESESIIGSKNRTIYLTSVGQDGRETFMYSGEWRRPNEQSDVDAAINAIIAESTREQNLQSILDKINAEKASLTSQSEKDAANLVSPIRDKGLAPTVNRFGIKGGKSIQATGKNMVSGNTTANSNATKKQTTHTVAKDETIKTISIKYGVSIDSIKNANSLTTNSVTVGQKLIIVF